MALLLLYLLLISPFENKSSFVPIKKVSKNKPDKIRATSSSKVNRKKIANKVKICKIFVESSMRPSWASLWADRADLNPIVLVLKLASNQYLKSFYSSIDVQLNVIWSSLRVLNILEKLLKH